ncbi:hypothetical protein VZT92_020372 [Zoarces viviparus]|uniref:Uncharacterized protein n=1 Tax=Zoarces viviparus TaxID=48416 RepID=A0AAW1EDH2_ZOAVI
MDRITSCITSCESSLRLLNAREDDGETDREGESSARQGKEERSGEEKFPGEFSSVVVFLSQPCKLLTNSDVQEQAEFNTNPPTKYIFTAWH